MLGISTRPYSDHFVQAFFGNNVFAIAHREILRHHSAMISCASGYGCIALMQSTKVCVNLGVTQLNLVKY
jgi:hypothetical protein